MTNITAAGTRIYIGGFGPLASEAAWTEIADVQNIPEIGEQINEIAYSVLNGAEERYEKGVKGTVQMPLEFVRVDDDDGQADLKSAFADRTPGRDYNFRIVWGPDPVGGSTNAAAPVTTFKGKVMSFVDNIGTVEGMIRGTAMIRPKTNSITFAPSVP